MSYSLLYASIMGRGTGATAASNHFTAIFGERRGKLGGHEPFSQDTNAFFVSLNNAVARRILALLRWWLSDAEAKFTTADAAAHSPAYQGVEGSVNRARADFEWLAKIGILRDTRHSGRGVTLFIPPPLSSSQEPDGVPFVLIGIREWPEKYREAFSAWLDS